MMNNRQGTISFQTQDQNKKRVVSLSTQAQTKSSSTTLHNSSANDQPKCLFCKKFSAKDKPVCFPQMIKNALYTKYSSSQNYYYAKDINELLSNAKTPKVIKFKDHQCLDDEEEYLKRYYRRAEYEGKIKMLTEYYKFHKDISRMFMKPIVDVLNRHHDKKRRFEYIRVTKMLKEQNKLKNSPTKPIEKTKVEEPKEVPITDRVLLDLDITTKKYSQKDEIVQDEVTETSRLINNYRIINTSSRDENKTGSTFKPKLKLHEKSGEDHGTLHELNMKLSEIITATHSRAAQMDFLNFFDNSVIKPNQNETITNLDKFLNYLQTSKEPSKPADSSGLKVISLKRRQSGTRSTPKMRPTETETQPQSQSIEKFASITNIYKAPAEAILKMTPNKNGPKRPVSREDFQKAIQPDLMRKKSRATIGTTIDDGRAPAEEKPVTVMALAKAVPYQTLASTLSNNKLPVATVSKIKNFEDSVKIRQQQGSPFKFLVQRSASREGLRQDHSSYASRRFHEPNVPAQPEERTRGTPGSNTRRRKSFVAGAGDLSRSNIRVVAKDQSVYNVKNVEAHQSEETNSHPNSHREMRITVDINSIGKGISQQEGFPNINGNPNTGKLSSAGGSRGHNGHSSSSHNYAIKIVNQKAMLVQTNNDHKDLTSAPHSNQDLVHVKLGPGSNSNYRSTSTMRGENHSRQGSMRATPENAMINLKNNVERFYKKTTDQRMINFAGQRHLTKSEERMNKLDATVAKNTSVPYAKTYRNHEQTTTLEGSRLNQEASNSVPRQIYTYNHNNIVNIYLNPHAEKLHTEAASGFNSGNNVQKGPVRPSEDIKASVRKLIDPNLLSRNILSKNTQNTMSQSQLKKSDSFYKDSKRYNSPLRVIKKDSIKLTHTKSGSLGTGSSVVLPTERSSGQFKLL